MIPAQTDLLRASRWKPWEPLVWLLAFAVTAAATTPYVRFRATGAVPAGYGKLVEIDFTQSTAARSANITLTEGYLAGAATYDVTIPDFTGVAGWDSNWGPKAGAATEWTVFTYGFTGSGLGSSNPVEGATFKGAARSGDRPQRASGDRP